jgi:hypothetical protein
MDFISKQFRAFLLAAHHRSFSCAAEALYITSSGLSVLSRELETELGFRLFDRTTRQAGLTSYGNVALPHLMNCGATGSDLVFGQLPIEHSIYDSAKLAYDACFLQDSAVRDLSFSM